MRFQLFDQLATTAAVAIFALLALPALAEEDAEPDIPRTVIKATKYIDVKETASVLELLDVEFAFKEDQNLIVLRGESYAVETAIKVIDALDEMWPNIDLRVFVLAASKEGEADVPSELEDAVGQLRGVFDYSGFQLLDTITLRVLEGRQARVGGGIRLGDDSERTGYHFSFQKILVVPEDDSLKIRLKGLRFDVDGPVAGSPRASLMTDVQIREGQMAVIGSSTPRGVGDTLILIIEAKAPPDPSQQND